MIKICSASLVWCFVIMANASFADSILPALPGGLPLVDSILVKKSQRKMHLIIDNQPYRSYPISLGGNPVGHKQREGDNRTPEGDYYIDWRNPNSAFHLSLRISYPNEDDQARAEAQGDSPGGMIMIHGEGETEGRGGRLTRRRDWTQGCIAVTNQEMEEIWQMVPDGTPISIKP